MALLNLRSSAKNAIRKIHDRISGSNLDQCDSTQLEQDLKSVGDHFKRFVLNHEALVTKAKEDELDSHEQLWEIVEADYNATCVLLNRRLKEVSSMSESQNKPTSSSSNNFEIKLDPLVIPTFDGTFHNWLSFKDVFQTLVHDANFPEAYKLAKLRQAVDPIKVPLIGAMYTGGYLEVWESLTSRYDNKKLLAEIHVSRFLNLKPAIDETAKALLSIVDTVQESLRALRVMKLPVDAWDALVVPIIISKLPISTQKEWGMASSSDEIPVLADLLRFLEKRAHSLTTEQIRIPTRTEISVSRQQRAHQPMKSHLATLDDKNCVHCQGLHKISRCQQFLALKPDQRFEALKRSNVCFNCLKQGHAYRQCSSGVCRSCGRKHHTVLCQQQQTQTMDSSATSTQSSNLQISSSKHPPSSSQILEQRQLSQAEPSISCLTRGDHVVLLATAKANAHGDSQEQRIARILCDPGSQVSLVTERFANSLNLHRKKHEVSIEGVGALAQTRTRGSVVLTLQSINSDFSLKINALVISSITSNTPAVHVDVNQWPHLVGLQLADPHFGTPGGIDMLIGSDVWGSIVQGDIVSGGMQEPHAQRTQFGWVIFGPASAAVKPAAMQVKTLNAQVCRDEPDLEELLQQFWKLEEVPTEFQADEECSRIFTSTHTRTTEGRYIVHIPFRSDEKLKLGASYFNALRQFHSLERRLARNEDLRNHYVKFMREYAMLEHMKRVDEPGDHANCYYIPHHAVTEKFRVVFNASAPTSNGVSLNDLQLAGPTIQDPLVHVIFRFRQFRFAVTADIEKMFRQILVTPKHRDFQRILWRESPIEDIQVYQLTTVTYGMKGSTFNAVRSLHQCAYDNFGTIIDDRTHKEDALAARDAILRSFYVDDFLISCDGAEEAVHLAENVDKILLAGRFKLRKWNSNSIQVLDHFANDICPSTELIIESPVATVLGLHWDPVADELFFNVKLKQCYEVPTKRQVLSEVAQLFDPTGLLAPVVITGKIFIQTLWAAGITWDALLPNELCEKWSSFRDGLAALSCLRVPRWLGMAAGEKTELHGFCDASAKAYAAVIYVKTHRSSTGEPAQICLLTARTKVAPLKGATIPRLELCAAHLLAVTLENVRIALGLTDIPYYLWSDSSIVLCWLKKQPTTLKPYVSNRVRQIQELTSTGSWHHVRSAQNPADCASRGLKATELLEHKLWWDGPDWLKKGAVALEDEPTFSEEECQAIREEEKLSTVAMVASINFELTTLQRDGKTIPLTERFSSLQKLLHTVAYMLRWLKRRRFLLKSTVINAFECEDALKILICIEQKKSFAEDIHRLDSGSSVSNSSRLKALNPVIDDDGILRVGGRLGRASSVPEDRRFPMILPKKGALVTLLISQAHKITLHGGPQLMLQNLRERFWILNGRQAVRNNRCGICRRQRGATLTQQMASLPRQRVNAARPFIAAGVDYCGPFTLRVGTKRSKTTVKTYLAIFVCMATKATHIEVVDDLSAQAFLDAFTRFISRRGICRDLYSDNGTTFVGANRLLKEDLAAWNNDNNKQSVSDMGTNWHFITPSAPHQGGLWEAAVKSAKYHLVRLVGSQLLWHNQLQTLAARIEACLNSRPITPLYDDPDDKMALTPGDFLIGAPLIAVPEPSYNEVPLNRLKHWQWLRQIHHSFWERWSQEYLSTLQTRSKWQRPKENIRVGDIVLIRHENLPPTHWRLGRVIEVHPGSDGLIRNATIKTQNGQCRRAVQKLCPLLDAADSIEPIGSTGQDV